MKKLILLLGLLLIIAIMLTAVLSRIPVGDRVAIVKIAGVIVNPLPTVKKIEKLRKDKSVKALVIRVDSPGGSVGASQEIYRAIERFRAEGKPVVVSMGNVAASGGYYVSAPADYIFANPGTITGSIGVIIQHVAYKELMEKIGVKATAIKTGKFKDTLNPFRELTPEEKKYLQETINEAYEQFIQAILKYRGKKISEDKLREVADGRVMTGEKAKELGLVDEVGGLEDAVEKAKELAGVPKAREFFVPEEKTLLQKVLGGEIEELKVLNSYSPLFYLMSF
ncbi:protease-4 [Hydrogenivirga caldilitoris]|uniref:Protease-4 n=1 Tax=Hydrogenivirga caldilitoris TaxID=246264 RepID=A0A497XSH5_9AQUI|nr:signal peptide peptidase SppA [Hydrogenivirga caldilitoris]RLJ71254.1 protease-4 [Hydrogenivirga caldilitoris]